MGSTVTEGDNKDVAFIAKRNEMNSVQTKLNDARNELLDLSLRNPLINYKLLKARGVEIVDESPPNIYQILVQDKRTMSFLPKHEFEDDAAFLFDEAEDEKDSDRYTALNFRQAIHLPSFKGVYCIPII